jgi:hypothetical protein
MPANLSQRLFIAMLCAAVLLAFGHTDGSTVMSDDPGPSAAAAERIYLAAGTTDNDEQATIGDPDEQATIGDPGEQATVGDPGEQATVGDPAEQAVIGDPGEEATIGDPDEKSKF